MNVKILSEEERKSCLGLYRKNDLFRQWMPILLEIETNITHIDAISVWYNAEAILRDLRTCVEFRDNEVVFIDSEITRKVKKEAVSAIMAVVLMRLMNATKEGHEEDFEPNDAMCNAIIKKHFNDDFFHKLIEVFFNRNIGNDGKKVVIKPHDPMTQNTSLDDMDDVAKEEVNAYKTKVIELTQGLKTHFNNWDEWEYLWNAICLDAELLSLLKEKSPRKNSWGINQKMVCNVIGMYAEAKLINIPKMSLSNALSGKNMRNYISNHCNYNTTDTPLSKEQHEKIEKMIQ